MAISCGRYCATIVCTQRGRSRTAARRTRPRGADDAARHVGQARPDRIQTRNPVRCDPGSMPSTRTSLSRKRSVIPRMIPAIALKPMETTATSRNRPRPSPFASAMAAAAARSTCPAEGGRGAHAPRSRSPRSCAASMPTTTSSSRRCCSRCWSEVPGPERGEAVRRRNRPRLARELSQLGHFGMPPIGRRSAASTAARPRRCARCCWRSSAMCAWWWCGWPSSCRRCAPRSPGPADPAQARHSRPARSMRRSPTGWASGS
jgi:hypothetical protein